MASVTASGTVPGTILENNRPGDWSASLALADANGALDVALTGPAAALFTATLNKTTRVVTIVPAQSLDREAYPPGEDPVLIFGLSVRLASGWQDLAQSWSVVLQGVDDAPPHALVFSSGGTVLETDIGAEIGMVQGSDADTDASLLTYSVAWPDSAWFELVGRTLKLRDGVDLLREGGTTRDVIIEVSNGRQIVAFALPIKILNVTVEDDRPAPPAVVVPPPPAPPPPEPPPPAPPPPEPPLVPPPPVSPPVLPPPPEPPPPAPPPPVPPVPPPPVPPPPEPPPPAPPPPLPTPLAIGEAKYGFTQVSAEIVQSVHFIWDAERIVTGADHLTQIVFPGGETVWIAPVARIEFLNGTIDFSGASSAAEVARVYATILGRNPDAVGLTYWVEHVARGMDMAQIADGFTVSPEFLTRFGGLTNEALVNSLYREALGREPEQGGFQFHVAALQGGQSQAQLVANFVQSAEAATLFEVKHPSGIWVTSSYANLVGMAYDAVFDRTPDRDGMVFWSSKLASGEMSALSLIQSIARSDEFQARHAHETDAEYVASIYRSALEREPEPAGLLHWVRMLAEHTLDRIDVVMLIGLSQEQQDGFAGQLPHGDAFLG